MSNRAGVLALAIAASLALSACGGGGGPKAPREAKAPAAGAASAKFSVPLPEGAKPEQSATTPGTEAYRVPSKVTLLDVNAFYEKQLDGKPLQGFEWCGGAAFTANRILRIWKKSETDQLLLDLTSDAKGVVIKVNEDKAAPAQTCPPSPPDLQQPPEGQNP